jgi:hypothetical protein
MTLDMGRPDLQRSETVTQGDTNRRWEVTLINGGAPFRLPPNWTAALTGIKPDGNGLQNGCSVVDGKIIYDFAAGKEIATCVGSYPVQFDIWDEVGELVASPKIYVNVLADVRPHAELESNGQYTQIGDLIGRVNQTDADVDILEQKVSAQGTDILAQGTDIAALKEKITTAGTVTIPASEWTDTLPKIAILAQPVLAKGTVALLMPGNTDSQIAARKAKITVQAEPYGNGNIVVQREDGEAPTGNIDLVYIIIKVDTPEAPPKAALIGVDAYGEGGGVGGLTQAETEMIVKKIVPEWARSSTPPDAQDVRADPEGTAKTLTEDLAAKIAKDLGNYYTKSQTYSRTEIDGKISAIPKFSVKVVTSLPTSGISETTVYLVKDSTVGGGLYTEYIRVNGAWEELGSQSLDLSGYVTDEELEEAINAALSDYLTAAKAAELYQPKGDYLTQDDLPTIPTALPNPKALTIIGKSYTGSTAVSVTADDILSSKSLTLVGEDAAGNTYTYTIFGKEA